MESFAGFYFLLTVKDGILRRIGINVNTKPVIYLTIFDAFL